MVPDPLTEFPPKRKLINRQGCATFALFFEGNNFMKFFLSKVSKNLGFLVLLLSTQGAYSVVLQGVFQSAIEMGGETLHSDYGRRGRYGAIEKRTISTGGGVLFSGGARISNLLTKGRGKKKFDVEVQTTLGLKFDALAIRGAHGSFYSFPVESMAFFRYKFFKVGLGSNYHLKAFYTDSSDSSYKAASTFNPVVEFQLAANDVNLGLRIGKVSYNIGGRENSGVYAGLSTTFAFPSSKQRST